MRINKFAILFVGGLSLASLVFAFVFYANRSAFEIFEFLANIFSGIFSSSLLALILAIIGYHEDRRKTLEIFYNYAQKAVTNFNRYEKDDDIEQTINTVLLMNEFDYTELGNAYESVCFLFRNKKQIDYIYNSIYAPILDLATLIREKSYHFKLYKKQLAKDKQHSKAEAAMNVFLDEIDRAIMSRTIQKIPNDDGTEFEMICIENKVVFKLREELGGRYFDIMYPWKKGKKEPTDTD